MIVLLRVRNLHIWLTLIFVLGLILLSCSVEKNTAATRNYHNLTSNYNIFFNANESYKEGLIRAEESFTDDFTSILPLFYYEDESIQQGVTPQMKRAIDKSTKIITFHSITAKPKVKSGRQSDKDKAFYEKDEYNKWIDDCYLLVGKAYMYQGEFFMASESFRHTIANYPTEDSFYPAHTWLVRAYNAIGEYDRAEEILIRLNEMEDFPKKHLLDLYTSYADYHIRIGEYMEAAEFLELALKEKPKKNKRIRYTFILAQIYKEAGDGEASIRSYKKVIRMNPPYVMAFNSKVNMAEAFQAGVSNSKEIKDLLYKMLKDSKNKEFQDQIYYALGNILMAEGEREKAIEYYHLSVRTSVQNNYQKGESCLTLADIYYNEPRYTLSAAYYDTAVNLLSQDYPNYRTLAQRSVSLNGLVRYINVFELQDSVQVLAGMTEQERFEVIDGIIKDVREQEEEARRRQQQAMEDLQFNRSGMLTNNDGFGNTQQSGGQWYFYNLNAKSFGQPEFRMKWGDRKLEDNWRRGNKQTVADLLEEDGNGTDFDMQGADGQIIDNKSREYYLINIPLTDSAMAVSDTKLEEALYHMGMIYRSDLLDYDQSIYSFEELVSRYPEGKYAMESYYYLHGLYSILQQPSKANYYKDLLSRIYPESHMAKLLTNPNYINELEEERKKVNRFYESVYNHYRNNNYSEVIRLAEQGISTYKSEEMMISQLDYLRALSIGAQRGKEALKEEMDSIVSRYPGTEIAKEAKDIIDYMYVAFPVIKEAEMVKEAVQLYTYAPEANHRFVIALKRSENLNLANFNLLNYNLDNFNSYDLKIEVQRLEVDYNLLVVTGFTNNEGVKRYADIVRTNIQEIMGELPNDSYEAVLISESNYSKLLGVKEFRPYLLFYRQNYNE